MLRSFALPIAIMLVLVSCSAYAEQDEYSEFKLPTKAEREAGASSWAFAFDNDILVPGSRDQDYTYGLNITYTGKQAERQWASLHESLDQINLKLDIDGLVDSGIKSNKIEYGLFGFTPEDISQSAANQDDRPYASLVYVSSTRESYHRARQESWQSTLTVGVLGLDLVGNVQNLVHSTYNGNQAEGWDNQISDGGEPTARYSLSRQNLLYRSGAGTEIKTTVQGSVGYITETSWSLSMRVGKIHTPWISFNPELTSYGEKSIPSSLTRVSEQYFWTGISFKLRPYNAFLEGQFRDSEVTYDADQINRGIVEAWMGYTIALTDGYSFSYSIRGHTSEINEGSGDRNVIWGGVLISKSIG